MNYRTKRLASLLGLGFLTTSMLFAGCGKSSTNTPSVETLNYEDMFTDRDLSADYAADDVKQIVLADGSSTSTAEGVSINGDIISITKEGIYEISGALSNGQIVVDAKKAKVQLVLKDVTITNANNAVIYVKNADKAFLTLADGTTNTLTSTGEFTADGDTNVDGSIFSKSDLTINGTGTLAITADSGNGIVSKDDLKVTGGILTVNAANHALEGKDSVRIADGELTLTAGKDGLHSENSDDTSKGFIYVAGGAITIDCDDDGVDSSSLIQIDGGSLSITAGDGSTTTEQMPQKMDQNSSTTKSKGLTAELEVYIKDGSIMVTQSYEAIEGAVIVVDGGEINVTSSDDGFNAAGGTEDANRRNEMEANDNNWITINGGNIIVNAYGDGIDSNGNFTVNGGTIYVSGPTNGGNGALDFAGTGTINGGTLIATGASGMAQNFGSDSIQCSMLVEFTNATTEALSLTDAEGKEIVSYQPLSAYNSVVISSPDIKKGSTYTLTCGTETSSVEMTNTIYGEGAGMGGFGGFGGDRKDGGPKDGDPKDGDRGDRGGFGEKPRTN